MATEKHIFNFTANEELFQRIKNFRFENRIETKSETIRLLIKAGLKKYEEESTNKRDNYST